MKQSINDSIKGEGGIAGMHHAIESKWPNANWFNKDNSYENITWEDENDIPKPSEAEIQTEIERLQVEYNSLQYQKDRIYPSLNDQMDMIMKDMRDGTTTHQTACEAVKAKYPKPE